MKKKKCFVDENQKKEILYNLVNAGLAGVLVLLGSLANGNITVQGISIAVVASLIVIATKFKEYWDGEASEYTSKLFSFVR
jgi:hypothetical protein